jgi:hypothetical protein
MTATVAGIVCIAAGVFAFGLGLLRNPTGRSWFRWRMLIGGPIVIVIGILLLTGVIDV